MHVAFILSALRAGGAERVVNIVANSLVEHGWSVTIVTFDAPADQVFHQFHPSVRFVRLSVAAGAWGALLRIRALHRELARGNYNLAVSFLTKINALALCAALPLKLPLIISERNNLRLQPMHPAWRFALYLLYRRADLVVMQTARSLDSLPTGQRGRAIVIPNPVQIPRAPQRRQRRRLIAGVGRLIDQKGFPDLITAFGRLSRLDPDARLTIWGEGPLRGRLQQQILSEDLDGKVNLAGVSATHQDWTGLADIFVLPSHYEGFPNVLLEAMAAGLPVIAADCDYGPRDLIRQDVNGLLVPIGDIDGLTRAMQRMLHDAKLANRFARAARYSIRDYDSTFVVAKWVEVLHRFGCKNTK